MSERAPSAYRLEQAMSAMERSLDDLQAYWFDEDLPDLLESHPASEDGMEVLRQMARYAMEMEDHVVMLTNRIDMLKTRMERFREHAETARGHVYRAMTELGIKRLPNFPDATVSLGATTPSVHVYDEDAVPAQYRVEVPASTRPDKRALLAALKQRAAAVETLVNEARAAGVDLDPSRLPPEIPGVNLSQGAGTLKIRRT